MVSNKLAPIHVSYLLVFVMVRCSLEQRVFIYKEEIDKYVAVAWSVESLPSNRRPGFDSRRGQEF